MRLLFDDRLAPITSEIGFVEADCSLATEAFVNWQSPIQKARGVSVTRRQVSGCLEDVLQALLPLTAVERRRFLFVPTASPWVAYFDNGYRGTDAMSVVSYLAKLIKCRGLRVVAVPDTVQGESASARGRYGATILEVYGPHDTEFLNYIRSISVANDGGRWGFHQAGTPLPFEDTTRYEAPRTRQRFTLDLLEGYLKELGLSPFDEDFYLPASDPCAEFIEKKGPVAPDLKEYTLAQARANF